MSQLRKRNRFIALDGAVKSVNRDLEAKARTPGRDQGPSGMLTVTKDLLFNRVSA